MVLRTTHAANVNTDLIQSNPLASNASTTSFSEQVASMLENYLGESANGSQLKDATQPLESRNSDGRQASAALMASNIPSPISNSETAAAADAPADTSPSDTPAPNPGLTTGVPLAQAMQTFVSDWSILTPQQVAFQLANASGTGGGDPTASVPGTSMVYGDLNQSQQFAYQYALNYGTGGLSMQDFLTQNAGPTAAWNQSYNQTSKNANIQAAVESSYQVKSSNQVEAGETPLAVPAATSSGGMLASSGNLDNLPNPALIQYLPPEQQAAARAALAAEGAYGANITAVADAYTSL
jgi:hypothetical protein